MLTHENNNPIYIRFAAIFEAENEEQLNRAREDLPWGQLREKALQLRKK